MLEKDIELAVKILKEGGLVAFPTETVYGLGADATNLSAIEKVFLAKQRPMDHPVIVHLGDISQLSRWAMDVSPLAFKLAHAFWPGPLTLILKKSSIVFEAVTGGQDTVGIRIPNHPVTLKLLKKFGGGIVGPSANRFGRISPTTADAVREELGDVVDYILEGGQSAVGVESTIIDMSDNQPVILRPGMITAEQIEAVLQQPVALYKRNAPRVSGSLELHYAPQTETHLISPEKLLDYLDQLTEFPCVVLARTKVHHEKVQCIVMPESASEYAHELYQSLRSADKMGVKQIIIEDVPLDSEWAAIRDRLQRASAG